MPWDVFLDDVIKAMPKLSDTAFVAHVREHEREAPDLTHTVRWRDAVRQEIDMRLLLKGAP